MFTGIKNLSLFVFTSLALLVTACSQTPSTKALSAAGSRPGMFPKNAYANITVKQLAQMLPAKDAPIVLYCRSARMSTAAAKTLSGLGYTNVMTLDGGFNAWKAAGYKLLNKG
ncbi:MAG TPA: hypothetical protein ENH50_04055 [Nitrospirae bacterium]|nr:molybdopterin biosynthesis protein MoeB [bacterium BMS3Abin08]HDY70820.1 hypothetical protein [Nitrospirota bacterium]